MLRFGSRTATSSLRAQSRNYFLAFNPKAKARPNWGLRGVGYLTSNTYHRASDNLWGMFNAAIPFLTGLIIQNSGFLVMLEEMQGDGPVPLDYGFRQDSKPWEFSFRVGEGYAHGKPTLHPAEGATEGCIVGSHH